MFYFILLCVSARKNSLLFTAKVKDHMTVHDEERPFLCSECGKGYKTMVQLRNHETLHKKPEDVSVKFWQIFSFFK